MDDLVSYSVLSDLKDMITHYGKSVEMFNYEYITTRSVEIKISSRGVFDFQTRWTGNSEPILVIILGGGRYMAITNTSDNYLSGENIELYNKAMSWQLEFVDSSISADVQAQFMFLARNLFNSGDGSLTKRAK